MTGGIVVALYLVYQLWVTGLVQARAQDRLRGELAHAWSAPAPAPAVTGVPRPAPEAASRPPETGVGVVASGSGIAVLRIPRFGREYAPVVVEGVSEQDLELGPGHHPGTAMPGEVGNFVVSGHRTTYGQPFSRLDELRAGDPIVVEARDGYFTYQVTRSAVVTPDRIDVTHPVPEKWGEIPTKPMLTFTTCHPRYSAAYRLVVFAELSASTAKSAGPPAALAGV